MEIIHLKNQLEMYDQVVERLDSRHSEICYVQGLLQEALKKEFPDLDITVEDHTDLNGAELRVVCNDHLLLSLTTQKMDTLITLGESRQKVVRFISTILDYPKEAIK